MQQVTPIQCVQFTLRTEHDSVTIDGKTYMTPELRAALAHPKEPQTMAAELTDEQIDALIASMERRLGGWAASASGSRSEAIKLMRSDIRALLATQGAEPVAWCDPSNPLNNEAFAWPGTLRPATHTCALYTASPPTAEVEKDAARYGWLRKGLALNVEVPTSKKPVFYLMAPRPEKAWGTSLDAAIDAAIQSDQAQAGKGE